MYVFFFRKKIDLFSWKNTIFDRFGTSYAILPFETPSRQKLLLLAFSQVFFKKTSKFPETPIYELFEECQAKNHLKCNLEKIVHDWPLWKNPVFSGKNNKFSKKKPKIERFLKS